MARSRAWCFTLNNPAPMDLLWLASDATRTQAKYLVYEHEAAPTTGTPHIQGYVYFHNPKTLKGAADWGGARAHWEPARGSAEQNRAYCTKDGGDVQEYGEMPRQGTRNDVDAIKKVVASGGSMKEVCEIATSYQSARMGELLLKYRGPTKRDPPTVLWFWGPTGTGKTRTAIEMAGDDYWISGRDLRWWDGYTSQSTVIIDDFRKDSCRFQELLRMLDRYPYRVETKGGSTWLAARTIIVTAPRPPQYYATAYEDEQQLLRRITETREFNKTAPTSTEVAGNTGSATSSETV